MNSIKTRITRAFLKLPEKWIYRLAGGKPLEIDGKTMDAHCQMITYLAARGTTYSDKNVDEVRSLMHDGLQVVRNTESESGVEVSDTSFMAGKIRIPVRVYRPDIQDPKACVLVYFHAGGGVLGDLEMCHDFCALLAKESQRPVLSVAYRLAPENPWPAGLNDAKAAYQWALAQAEHLGAAEGRAAVGGDSMGANYAAALCQEILNDGAPLPEFQLLIYPPLDFAHELSSSGSFPDIFPMSKDVMDFLLPKLLHNGVDREDIRLSPLCNTDLSELPKALIVTAGFDLLKDHGRLYHERLLDAGSDSEHYCFDHLPHGFVSYMGVSDAARKACVKIAAMISTVSG